MIKCPGMGFNGGRVQKTLTTASLVVMNEAKLVGTKPGATQFTRVSGAISAARAYPLQIISKLKNKKKR